MTRKRGILLLNFGGPETLEEVRPFLYRLFRDPAVLVGIPAPFRQMLAWTIATVKGGSSIEAYRAIGGGSPQLKWTRLQAEGLAGLLAEQGPHHRVALGMRLSNPSIEIGLRELRDWGAEELVLFPLFPQYSTTTSGTCLEEARRVLAKWRWSPELRVLERWPDHPGYVRLLRATLEERIAEVGQDGGPDPHVLVSAHSLPLRIIERGDPYSQDVERTVKAVTQGLDLPWSLAYQSRNGKAPWLSPYTEDELKRLGKSGVKRVIVLPISFVSDHIETLWELDLLYARMAREHGIEGYFRARSFNDDPEFARVLHRVLEESFTA